MITDKTERCDLYDAIVGSLLDFSDEIKDFKEEINQNKLNKLAWTLIKPNIVNSRKNYINGCKRGLSHPSTVGSSEPSISNSNIDLKKLRSRSRSRVDTTKKVEGKKEKKVKNGVYENVLLTKSEFDKLVEKFGLEKAKKKIIEMDEAIEMKGYKYKSHYLAILKWAKNEKLSGDELHMKIAEEIINEFNL